MSNPDQDLLLFVSAHELVLAEQCATLLEVSLEDAVERLDKLREQGLLTGLRVSSESPTAYRITEEGADLVDSALPPARPLDLMWYRHEVGIVWLWLAGRFGTLGQQREVFSRREMQAADATLRTDSLMNTLGATFRDEPPGLDLDVDRAYPDLGLVPPDRGWATVDLVLSVPDRERLRVTLAREHRNPLLRGQLFLVEKDGTQELIESTAAELGLADRVRVQVLAEDGIAGGIAGR